MISDDFNYSGGGVVAVIAWIEAPELISKEELEDLMEALPSHTGGYRASIPIPMERLLLSLAIIDCVDVINRFLKDVYLDHNGPVFRSMATEIIRRRNAA
tara:strand:- start:1246 stop:1545 length:300 start_codon:yes stop_codon:yes gene_type:complete